MVSKRTHGASSSSNNSMPFRNHSPVFSQSLSFGSFVTPFEERDIKYLYFHFLLDDVQYDDDFGESYPFDKFYQRIVDGGMPTTCQRNVDEHMEFFEKFLQEGKDVLFVSLSSGISGSFNSSQIAANELKEKYPDRKIYVVDSLAASSGYGLLMKKLADLKDEGKTIDEVYNWAEENKLNVHHWVFATDLTHLKRGGRIDAKSAIVGTMLKIKPIINVDVNGKLSSVAKVRGRKASMTELVNRMKATIDPERFPYISVYHGDCPEEADTLEAMVKEA